MISNDLKHKLRNYVWTHKNLLDLHDLGVHYHNSDFLPSWIDPLTYSEYLRNGLTPPVSLPKEINITPSEIEKWLDSIYYLLEFGGVHHLGNEFNVHKRVEFEKENCLKVCIVKVSSYDTVDGAFGHYIINNWVSDFDLNIVIDYAYPPPIIDTRYYLENNIPLLFGNTTKQPLQYFDVIIFSLSYQLEKFNIPFYMRQSGIPLYRWERYNHEFPYYEKCPLVCMAGMGATCFELGCADHPIYGSGQNALCDLVLIGEGETMDLKLFQQAHQTLKMKHESKEELIKQLNSEKHEGIYDPSCFLIEYHDKDLYLIDYNGSVLTNTKLIDGGSIKSISKINQTEKKLEELIGESNSEYQDLLKMI